MAKALITFRHARRPLKRLSGALQMMRGMRR
jgi:hypothetical protein